MSTEQEKTNWPTRSRTDMSKEERKAFCPARTVVLSILFVCVAILWSPCAQAQNIQHTQNVADLGIRSSLRVEPTTLGLNIQIPLREYQGRGGSGLSASLFWSSKVWRISYVGNQEEPLPFGGVRNHAIVEGKYAEHSVSGWTSGLDLPWYEFTGGDQYYGDYGDAIPEPTEYPPNWQFYTHSVKRMLVHMPDGSSHELRSSDQIFNGLATNSGTYYAVDGSRIKYDILQNSAILYLPDGSRYVYPGQGTAQYIDRNGNTLTYNSSAKQWTDTLGRTINMPPLNNTSPADSTYSVPGVGVGGTINYTFRWRYLADARTDPSQPLRSIGDYPNTTPSLFVSVPNPDMLDAMDYVRSSGIFNPVVLSEIVLPTGNSYKFSYNVWGEVDKITYPTGGYERFNYAEVAALSQLDGVYAQGNRGVVERWISASGNGTDENRWQYSPSSTTAPDGTITTRSIHRSNVNAAYGFQDARAGMPYDERVYAPNGQMLRRKLTEYAVSGPAPGGYGGATRNPRVTKEVEIVLDTGGSALSKTRTYSYDLTYQFDVGIDQTSISEYDWAGVDQSTAQTGTIASISSGSLVRTTQISYLTSNANYRNRNILGLPSSTTIYDGSPTDNIVVAQSLTNYDESAYPPTYGAVTGWIDPQTQYRGNPTTTSRWLNFNGSTLSQFPNGTYVSNHAEYDQCGNVRFAWDAKGNQSQLDYSSAYQYTFPTTSTSSIPDPSGQCGATLSLVSRLTYDPNTGVIVSIKDPNDRTTTYGFTDPQTGVADTLNRIRTITRPDGGVTTYNYNDVVGSSFVQTLTKQDSTRNLDSYQFFDKLGRPNRSFLNIGGGNYITSDTQYDNLGRVYRVSNPYLSSGSASAINPSGRWTTTGFDALGRVVSVTTPDNSEITTSYGGSTSGILGTTVTVTDQFCKVTDPSCVKRQRRSLSDALGRLVRVDEPDKNSGALGEPDSPVQPTYYTYDILSNLKRVDQGRQRRYFLYDSLSRLIRARNPEQGVNQANTLNDPFPDPLYPNSQWSLAYSYDANGNLLTKVDARNVTATYAYDALNRNRSTTYTNDPAGTPTVSRFYDGWRGGNFDSSVTNSKGQLWQTETDGDKGSRTTIDTFDALGRPLTQRQQFFTGETWSPSYPVSRTYDLVGHVLTQTYPSGHTIAYDYDSAGRISNFVGNLGDGEQRTYASEFQYTELGAIQQEKFGTLTPLYHKQRFNERGQLWDMRLSTVPFNAEPANGDRGSIVNYYSNNFIQGGTGADNNGNLLRQEANIPGSGFFQQNFGYDQLNRLTSASEKPNGTGNDTWKQTFTFDIWGNRSIDQDQANSFGTGINRIATTVDPLTNRLTSLEQSPVTYDDSGNLTADGHTFSETVVPTYDAENRLVQVDYMRWSRGHLVAARPSARYSYDGAGHRVRRSNNSTLLQIYGMDGELLAEYQDGGITWPHIIVGVSATSLLPQKEYGYRNGQLLITASSGDNQRIDRFITNFYFAALGREPSSEELTQERAVLLQAGVQNEAQLVTAAVSFGQQLFNLENPASEYNQRQRTDVQFVTDLYFAYLQRPPDTGGLGYYVGQLQAPPAGQGVSRTAMRDGFGSTDDTEFVALVSTVYGINIGNSQERARHYLSSMYLGAVGNDGNFNNDLGTLRAAAAEGRDQVVLAAQAIGTSLFAQIVRDETNYSDEDFVLALFHAFLQREPSESDVEWWLAKTQSNGRQAMVLQMTELPAMRELAGTLYREILWLVPDHLGTPRLISERSGSLAGVKRHDYLPFGEELPAGFRNGVIGYDSSDTVRQKFTQKERDNETGLDYFLARYYSSTQGRFTSPDEFTGGPDELFDFSADAAENPTFYADLTQPQSLNKYQYCLNSPLSYVDPDGHQQAITQRIILDQGYFGRFSAAVGAATERVVNTGLDVTQTVLSGVGVFLDPADGANAAISTARGNYKEAALDAAGAAGPVFSVIAGGNRLRKLAKVAEAVEEVADAANATRKVEKTAVKSAGEMAEALSNQIGKNSVAYRTPNRVGHIDLRGKAHFDKASGQRISTPHVQERPLHRGPDGRTNVGSQTTRPATKQDIRTARKIIERK